MSKADELLKALRRAEPMTRELMLADAAKDLGDGFAKRLREQLREAIRNKASKARR